MPAKGERGTGSASSLAAALASEDRERLRRCATLPLNDVGLAERMALWFDGALAHDGRAWRRWHGEKWVAANAVAQAERSAAAVTFLVGLEAQLMPGKLATQRRAFAERIGSAAAIRRMLGLAASLMALPDPPSAHGGIDEMIRDFIRERIFVYDLPQPRSGNPPREHRLASRAIYAALTHWCTDRGWDAPSETSFGRRMAIVGTEMGLRRYNCGVRFYWPASLS